MKARIFPLFCGLMISGAAAADINYNFVDFGFRMVAVDVPEPFDGDGVGPQVEASWEVYGPFTALFGASYTDFSDDNIELTDVDFGVGWNYDLGKNASTFVNVLYLYTDINTTGVNIDQDGYGVTLGYRAENHTPWEFIGTIDYVNVESGVETGGGVTLMYDVTRHFSVTGGVSYFDQSVMAHLGARYNFNRRNR